MPLTVTFCFPTCPQQWFRREWTVIPAKSRRILAKSRRIPAKSEKMAGIPRIRRNPVNPLLWRHVPGQIYSSLTSLGPKKIKKREEKKKPKLARFRQIPGKFVPDSGDIFAGITVEGILGKKIESAYIERNWNFGGAHCKFLNIGGRIENHPKLQGANPYFPLIIILLWGWLGMSYIIIVDCISLVSLICLNIAYH